MWAHSDILKARSEFFETMLGGAFAEGSTTAHGHGRQVHEINLEGADFTTVYWLVKVSIVGLKLSLRDWSPTYSLEHPRSTSTPTVLSLSECFHPAHVATGRPLMMRLS